MSQSSLNLWLSNTTLVFFIGSQGQLTESVLLRKHGFHINFSILSLNLNNILAVWGMELYAIKGILKDKKNLVVDKVRNPKLTGGTG